MTPILLLPAGSTTFASVTLVWNDAAAQRIAHDLRRRGVRGCEIPVLEGFNPARCTAWAALDARGDGLWCIGLRREPAVECARPHDAPVFLMPAFNVTAEGELNQLSGLESIAPFERPAWEGQQPIPWPDEPDPIAPVLGTSIRPLTESEPATPTVIDTGQLEAWLRTELHRQRELRDVAIRVKWNARTKALRIGVDAAAVPEDARGAFMGQLGRVVTRAVDQFKVGRDCTCTIVGRIEGATTN